jgi:hypothetical protein
MKIKVFDRVETLNEYLATAKKNVEVKFQSFIVGQIEGRKGEYEVIDRFLVIEK